MPMPPTLPVLDWRAIVAAGQSYSEWLNAAESAANAVTMREASSQQPLTKEALNALGRLERDVYVVAIAEDWCGDVVRHVPVLEKLAATTPRIRTCYHTRAYDPGLFLRFLTNGGEALPKFIFLSETFVECGSWGPMQLACREWIARGKAVGNVGDARKQVSRLYREDSEKQIVVSELIHHIEIAATARI